MLILLFWLFSLVHSICEVSIIGAGVGGLYSAYRLTQSGVYSPNQICIFEKSDRVGGRIHTVRDVFPTKSSVDPGAHRYQPQEHQIMDSIVTNILNLSTSCYSRTSDCFDNGDSYYFLRNKYSGDLFTSNNVPYFVNIDEKWNKQKGSPSPVSEILALYPFIIDNYDKLTSPNPSIRYPAIKSTLDTLREYKVNGLYPNELSPRSLLNHSSEYWNLWADSEGEDISLSHVNIYDILRELIYYAIDNVDGAILKIITDTQGNEIGYSSVPEGLARLLIDSGVSIIFNMELSGIYQSNNDKLELRFIDRSSIISDKVILNIPQKSLLKLASNSVIFTAANQQTIRLYNLFQGICAVKAYLYYPEPWWRTKLELVNAELSTTEDIRYVDFIDGNVEMVNNKQSGFVNVAYANEQSYCPYFQAAQKERTNPILIIYANSTNKVEADFFQDISNTFLRSLQGLFTKNNVDPNVLVKPEILVMGIWVDTLAWHQVPISNFKGGYPARLMLNPVNSIPIYVANEAYSFDQGWAEGSLAAAEKILQKYFGLTRPTWLSNSHWYNAIILNPNV